MKFLVTFAMFAAVQAKAVGNGAFLEFVHPTVEANPSYTAAEWKAVLEEAEDFQPEDENAGKVHVDIGSRIISGTPVSQGQIPWQAFFIMDGASACGGSVISSNWVLTAFHCLQRFQWFEITLGSTNRLVSQPGVITQRTNQTITPASNDNETINDDIGLLRLTAPVTFNNIINAIRLPRLSQASQLFVGENAIVSGFGITSSTSVEASANLMVADVSIISNAACAASIEGVRANNICSSGVGGRTPCSGDSGGALVVREADGKYTEVGIVSRGAKDCPAGSPDVYTRVTNYLNWISANAQLALRP